LKPALKAADRLSRLDFGPSHHFEPSDDLANLFGQFAVDTPQLDSRCSKSNFSGLGLARRPTRMR